MNDRFVRQVSPTPEAQDTSKRFSEYLSKSNIVLLGDPGAGKSHLFRHFASDSGGVLVAARDFLNLEPEEFAGKSPIFIDALDEKRAGRGDQSTIDLMVGKLGKVRPELVRIACRAADWLGETDLAAFQAYFKGRGETVVLSLDPLSESEQQEVLAQRAISNPEAFLAEAERRGLGELLKNPQTLVMLADVVATKDWPRSRSELFRESVQLLLSEHNLAHTRQESGSYTASELLTAAGAACAIRLISDIDGISLADGGSTNANFPTYREITLCDRHQLRAALGRRAFIFGKASECVDYTHRTVAEYLGAHWLANQIQNGLPFSRVRALLGVEFRPASELRGLHAWMAVFLPDYAAVLINADPFGVLSYGDASALSPRLRAQLLEALAKLADLDPWFRGDNWSSAALAALSGPDMEEGFKRILRDKRSGYSIRSVVLDAVATGTPIPGLAADLVRIAADPRAQYGERARCIEAMDAIPAGRDLLARLYPQIGKTESDLRLRGKIIERIFGGSIGPADVAALLIDAFDLTEDMVGGALWSLADAVPSSDVVKVLNLFCESLQPRTRKEGEHHRNAYEVLHVVDVLLARVLTLYPEIGGQKLSAWLQARRQCAKDYGASTDSALKGALDRNPDAVLRVVDAEIESLDVEKESWSFVHRTYELLIHSVNDRSIVESLRRSLDNHRGKKREFLYELALQLSFRIVDAPRPFDALYDLAEGDSTLRALRDRSCVMEIPEWKTRESERRQKEQIKRQASREKIRADFARDRTLVRSATHFGWLTYLGQLYFGMFSDVERSISPEARLSAQLGEENARIAIEALLALVDSGKLTPLPEIVQMQEQQKYFRWWYAVIAGLDERVESGRSSKDLPDDYLASALAIDCLHPTFWHQGSTSHHIEHKWKMETLRERPGIAVKAYLALAESALRRSSPQVDGLHELMTLKELEIGRPDLAVDLLERFPSCSGQALRYLLPAALKSVDTNAARLMAIAKSIVSQGAQEDAPSYAEWLAVGYLLAPTQFASTIQRAKPEKRSLVVWAFRNLSGLHHRAKGGESRFSAEQLDFIIRLTGELFPRTGHPKGGWSGDTNAWDASEFVLNALGHLAADTRETTAKLLGKLAKARSLASYKEDVKHAVAQQRIATVDRQFEPPTWRQALETLKNGVPSNMQDLQALVLQHLNELVPEITSANTDIYKRFWNEDARGKVTTPKNEESCRDGLVDLLRVRLTAVEVRVEPEGHMAADKRADIVVLRPAMKLVVELKRDYHADLWTAIQNQLERFYTRDPEARGFGIYGVFWYGARRPRGMRRSPRGIHTPTTAVALQQALSSLVPPEKKAKIAIVVLDVSGEIDAPLPKKLVRRKVHHRKAPKRKRMKTKKEARSRNRQAKINRRTLKKHV